MAEYQKRSMVTGAWARAEDIKNGSSAEIVSEVHPSPSQFKDKDGNPKVQNVGKVRFENIDDTLNVSLNRATIEGLIDAFGTDSVHWMHQPLRVETEKMRVSGKAVTALYLIPNGYKRADDENGYAVIVKEGESVPQNKEEVDPDGVPF